MKTYNIKTKTYLPNTNLIHEIGNENKFKNKNCMAFNFNYSEHQHCEPQNTNPKTRKHNTFINLRNIIRFTSYYQKCNFEHHTHKNINVYIHTFVDFVLYVFSTFTCRFVNFSKYIDQDNGGTKYFIKN